MISGCDEKQLKWAIAGAILVLWEGYLGYQNIFWARSTFALGRGVLRFILSLIWILILGALQWIKTKLVNIFQKEKKDGL